MSWNFCKEINSVKEFLKSFLYNTKRLNDPDISVPLTMLVSNQRIREIFLADLKCLPFNGDLSSTQTDMKSIKADHITLLS